MIFDKLNNTCCLSTGTDLFNTNNISIRELNKFNYLKDPLNLRFNQSNVKLNPKNTNNNEFFKKRKYFTSNYQR